MAAPDLPPRDRMHQSIVDALARSLPLGHPLDPHDLDAAADAVIDAIAAKPSDPGAPCTGCRYADGRSGQWPFALYCEAAKTRLPAHWMRKTPPAALGCGPEATLYEPKERD